MQLVTGAVHRILLIIVQCAACDKDCAPDIVDNLQCAACDRDCAPDIVDNLHCAACDKDCAPDIVDNCTLCSL